MQDDYSAGHARVGRNLPQVVPEVLHDELLAELVLADPQDEAGVLPGAQDLLEVRDDAAQALGHLQHVVLGLVKFVQGVVQPAPEGVDAGPDVVQHAPLGPVQPDPLYQVAAPGLLAELAGCDELVVEDVLLWLARHACRRKRAPTCGNQGLSCPAPG
jgi:hypothetical protein